MAHTPDDRLREAAPELLKALAALVAQIDAHQSHAWATSDIDTSQARAAVAKAEGRED